MACKILVTLLAILLLASFTEAAINCRRRVFAAECRGVSAKRAQLQPYPIRDFTSGDGYASSSNLHPKQSEDFSDDQVDYDTLPAPDDYLRTLLRKYWNKAAITNEAEA